MFEIDLLKGNNKPVKPGAASISLGVATVVFPFILTIVLVGTYMSNRVAIAVQQNTLTDYDTKLANMAEAFDFQKTVEARDEAIASCMAEIAGSIRRHSQWSPVIMAVVEHLPEQMRLANLQVSRKSIRKKIPNKDNPKQMIDVSVPVRTLHVSLTGRMTDDCDGMVRDFRDRLGSPGLLGPKLQDIKVAQAYDDSASAEFVTYEIYFIFKPEF